MLIPGVDFTTIGKVAKAYFKCVNDNGGINGRPIQYILYTEQLNPAQQAALARKLIESDKVVGIVGNTSFTECGTNWKYYKSKGFIVIGAGVQAECFGTPAFVEIEHGPALHATSARRRRSSGAARSRSIIASPDTISAYADGGVLKVAKAAGIPGKSFPIKLPVTDANSIVLQLVPGSRRRRRRDPRLHARHGAGAHEGRDRAGSRRQGACGARRRRSPTRSWRSSSRSSTARCSSTRSSACSTPARRPTLGSCSAILKKYAPKIALQAFAPDGLHGRRSSRPKALLNVKGAVTAKSYNAAVRKLKNVKTDMLCKPWYVGNAARRTTSPNNWDITVDYKDGKVVAEGEVLRTSGRRPGDRPDARLGEEVQAQHRRSRRQRSTR